MQPNMLQDSPTPTQLTYSMMTKPMPVQVSLSATVQSIATLVFVVSCPQSADVPVTISKIAISIPVDTAGYPQDPTNLAMTAPLLSNVSITSSGSDQWVISGVSPGVFVFSPKGGGTVNVFEQSLTIEFTQIEVNTVVGTALITINESASTGTGTQTVAVAKFPYGFYAGNFTSKTPMVQNGQKPELSWMGSSNATYLMLYESNPPVDVSNVRTWSPPNGLTQMTTFILQVTAQEAGQSASMDFSITIEVANPSLTAQDLTVLTNSWLKGNVNVGVTAATPVTMTVAGDVKAQGILVSTGAFTAQSSAGILGTLNVTGAATFQNALNVSGAATFNGAVTANSSLTAKGVTSIFGATQSLNVGTYTAGTDGFVIGTVFPPSPSDILYDFTITGASGGMMVQATGGGTLKAVNPPNYYGVTTGGMFILPVRKGASFTLGYVAPYLSSPPKPFYTFYWIPLGFGGLSATLNSSFEEPSVVQLPPSPMLDRDTRLPIRVSGQNPKASKKLAARKKSAAKKSAAKKKPATKKTSQR